MPLPAAPIDFIGIFEGIAAAISGFKINIQAITPLVSAVNAAVTDGKAALAAVQAAIATPGNQADIAAAATKVQAEIADLQAATAALLAVVTPASSEHPAQ